MLHASGCFGYVDPCRRINTRLALEADNERRLLHLSVHDRPCRDDFATDAYSSGLASDQELPQLPLFEVGCGNPAKVQATCPTHV